LGQSRFEKIAAKFFLPILFIYVGSFKYFLSTKSTISQKLKIGKLFSPRCKDFFPLKDMHIPAPPPSLRNSGNFMKDAE